MSILVAYASRHGATQGIAERIASRLQQTGLWVTLKPIDQVGAVGAYEAFVVGSAAYRGHWMSEATTFMRHHRDLLARRPVWLFSSGPVGAETVDAKGRDVIEASAPEEFGEFAEAIHPRDLRVFFGAFDPDARPIGVMERLAAPFMHMPAVRAALPAGDFRDWPAIEAWADGIARELDPSGQAEAIAVSR
jgi:menaquinone-dependent protoporphyrinogen oxidase